MSITNYFSSVTVNVTSYGDAKKIEFGFMPEHIIVNFISGTGPVFFSFNGDENHGSIGDPTSTGQPRSIYMAISRNEMWFKGSSGDETVEVTAWA